MASLKEIKTRIASVRNTLKITSAMKMVAAAKLHHAQQVTIGMQPYEAQLHAILTHLLASQQVMETFDSALVADKEGFTTQTLPVKGDAKRVAIVAFSSNSSLCGGFNSNAIRQLTTIVKNLREHGFQTSDIDLYTIGRKISDAARRMGFSPIVATEDEDTRLEHQALVEHPNYDDAAFLAQRLIKSFVDDKVDQIILVYNHYVSTASQPSVYENYLPLVLPRPSKTSNPSSPVNPQTSTIPDTDSYCILEPSGAEVLQSLLPKVLLLKIYSVLLDTNAAEHAARTVAMQIASDNAQKLLDELTLQYNKSRQQKITAEILDIVGGLQR